MNYAISNKKGSEIIEKTFSIVVVHEKKICNVNLSIFLHLATWLYR